jgi:hypothetical protein
VPNERRDQCICDEVYYNASSGHRITCYGHGASVEELLVSVPTDGECMQCASLDCVECSAQAVALAADHAVSQDIVICGK